MTHRVTTPESNTSTLVRAVGHDLRNKLGVMQNSVYYLRMKVGRESEKVAKHIEILTREIAVSNRTVVDLMDLAAPKEPHQTTFDINAALVAALDRSSLRNAVDVTLQLADDLPTVRCDAEQMAHALDNVLAYECGTLSAGDRVRIASWCNGLVHLEFIDTGTGLSDADQAGLNGGLHVGTCPHLGLVVARRLIQVNGGAWDSESRAGMGTRISIALPRACDLAASSTVRMVP